MKRILLILLSLVLLLSVVSCSVSQNENSNVDNGDKSNTTNNTNSDSDKSTGSSDSDNSTDITSNSSNTPDVNVSDTSDESDANVSDTSNNSDTSIPDTSVEPDIDIPDVDVPDVDVPDVDVPDVDVPDIDIPDVDDPDDVEDVREVNGILIVGTRAMETFGGSASGGEKTAKMLNEFKQAMGNNVNVYVLPAPLASAFYAPEGYERSINRHKECFYGVRDALENVGFVDSLAALSLHSNEEIYFRTDHHWQALAAYYCSEELARIAGVSFDDISTFVKKSHEGVLGSFYTTYTKDEVLRNNPDTMVWYEPTREYTVDYYSKSGFNGDPITGRTLFSTNEGYTKFIYGDSYTSHIKTNVGNGRKLLLFKDSYGNALAPFLVGSFDEIIVADYRYFKDDVSDFVQEHGITDVCFSLAAFKVNNCNAVDIIV